MIERLAEAHKNKLDDIFALYIQGELSAEEAILLFVDITEDVINNLV